MLVILQREQCEQLREPSRDVPISRKKAQRGRRKPGGLFNDFLFHADLAQIFLESLMFS